MAPSESARSNTLSLHRNRCLDFSISIQVSSRADRRKAFKPQAQFERSPVRTQELFLFPVLWDWGWPIRR